MSAVCGGKGGGGALCSCVQLAGGSRAGVVGVVIKQANAPLKRPGLKVAATIVKFHIDSTDIAMGLDCA